MRKTKLAPATPFSGSPRINGPSILGASPRKPILYRIPVTGERPVTVTAEGLPDGLILENGILRGSVEQEGIYSLRLTAENALGQWEKVLSLEIFPNRVLLTPLLGFTTWNAYAERVTQQNMLDSASALVSTGLSEYGYSYVNLDSGWQYQYGGEKDAVQPNPKFPDMKKMTDEIHALGLKCGIYSTPMLTAWGCPPEYESIPGCTVGEADYRFSLRYNGGIGVIHKEKNNALQWEEWGFDYLKYDWSPADPVNAELMRQELIQCNRDFGYCVTIRALPCYGDYWSRYCNSYRNNPDSKGNWETLLKTYESYFPYVEAVNKGHFFDLDMLDVGQCVFRDQEDFYTEDEMIVSYSLRAFLNSPLQISSVLQEIGEFEMALYGNEEILAVHQDAAIAPSRPVFRPQEKICVFQKELEDGTFAYGCFNLSEEDCSLQMLWAEKSALRDLWAKEDLGENKEFSMEWPRHTVRIFKSEKPIADWSLT